MSEPKFTPGPYRLGFAKSGARYIYAGGEQPIKPNVRVNKTTSAKIVATATLLAASWDMYEALKDAEKQLVQMYRAINPAANEGEGNRMADNDWSVKSIRSALAKAVKP